MSGKKQYQFQIDEDANQQEIEMQGNQVENGKEQEVFTEKQNTSSSANSKKKRGAARIKAKKSVQSASTLERQNSASTPGRQNQSAIINFNQNTSVQNVKDLPFMKDYTHLLIKKDPHYSSLEKTVANYFKDQEIELKEQSMPRLKKVPKQSRGIFEYLTSSAWRYILIEKGMYYTLRKIKKDTFVVTSSRELSTLFKIYEDKQHSDQIQMCFINKERDAQKPPIRKSYTFENTKQCKEFLSAVDKILKLQGFQVVE